jgi:hypothetical protein
MSARSRFPTENTWVNGQGGTTAVIGNMMITTGFINRIGGGHIMVPLQLVDIDLRCLQ